MKTPTLLKKNRLLILLITLLIASTSAIAQPLSEEKDELSEIFEKADEISSLRSLLIQQHGELLGESFFNGRSPNRAFNIKSASKSIIGLLVGIAIEEGFIPSVDEPISTYFPEYFEENPDPKKEQITVRNLLSMQTGLRSTSSGNYGAWVMSDNWVEYALDQDFVSQIDGRMVYSTGTSHLLSVIITKAAGMSTKAFAEKFLFAPLDVTVGGWDRDPQGYYMGGNNLALKPSDMLKIGQMLIDKGVWEGEQIISMDWIIDSFKTYTYSNYNPYGYGYQWWNKRTGKYTTLFAWGHGGQYIMMIPELDAVVVMTSSVTNASRRRTYKRPVFVLLEDHIIPYLESRLELN
ncbi:MAG: serine hydrolase [Balneolaceae bacterium]|nr:serine hydrolase [Balneolaceae bacterium]MBO6546024.1 serine hydrolase [Balneolaceae bacterium]MBO6647420.1 serine hydrolase [Balneolaceae bacterium]